ncbi:arylsulfotransferase (asst) [Halorarum halophilum]|uniref:Arylsulfotransferase (Asst) n=1 Tax=Halorarum halophilum TaxID=2743090 RepID=A0A7D5GND9_9EURY|nr:arylsulfotransferase (asst) [Halobaculum halophilum]QLG29264.1 arylsulfotransferase (asst) [Halobaculum halophilum]
MGNRRRVTLGVLTLLAAAVLAGGFASAQFAGDSVRGDPSVEQAFRSGDTGQVVGERDNITIVGTDSTAFVGDEGSGARQLAELVAFAPDGSIYYYDNTHTRYWDVDPVEGTNATVEYVYADHLTPEDCGSESVCTRNGVERVNLTTGETTHVYSRITPGKHSTRWHDVDRIDDERLLVADIDRDRTYIVNATTGIVEWEWDAQSQFDPESGGPYPDDWTHINDVEAVEIDGREAVMVSIRNHDQVAFIDLERGYMEDWTLGADDDHSVLYEQHNPDFIPAERGGPAVLVADSERGRVVEYQRVDGGWERSWVWADQRMTWPRDADRLPNGHTLITDSNGDRVFEIDQEGEIVWTADVGFPYESERLGTGDESEGGESADSLGLESNEPPAASGEGDLISRLAANLPPSVVNAIAYVLPPWMGIPEILAALTLLVVAPWWLLVEYRLSSYRLSLRTPFTLGRR